MTRKANKSAQRKAQFSSYAANARVKTNRQRRLERHMKKHPNDAQAAETKIDAKPRRSAPKTRVWSSQARETAQLFARVGLNGNHALGGKASERVGDGEDKRYYGDEKYDKWQKKQWAKQDAAEAQATKQKRRNKTI